VAESNELDCKIYLETDQAPDQVASLVAAGLTGNGLGSLAGRTVHTKYGEVDVRKNKEASESRAREFPDGFLHFRYYLEVYPLPTARLEDRVAIVASLLRLLWSRGLPAVAACDYEKDLPGGGGYNNPSVPWPSSGSDPKAVLHPTEEAQ
jgi:hypothetical protein